MLRAVLLMLCLASPAWAHGDADWIMRDPETRHCCGPKDCRPLPFEAVRIETGGYAVTVVDRVFHIPFERKRPSIDNRFWICLDNIANPARWEPRCFFGPDAGS